MAVHRGAVPPLVPCLPLLRGENATGAIDAPNEFSSGARREIGHDLRREENLRYRSSIL